MGPTVAWTQPSQAGFSTPLLFLLLQKKDLFNPQEAGGNIYGTT